MIIFKQSQVMKKIFLLNNSIVKYENFTRICRFIKSYFYKKIISLDYLNIKNYIFMLISFNILNLFLLNNFYSYLH